MSYVPASVQAAQDNLTAKTTALSQAVALALQTISAAQVEVNAAASDLNSLISATWPAPAPPADPGLVIVDTTGKTDVTSAIQAVYNKAKDLGTAAKRFKVTIPKGIYLVDATTGIWPLSNTDTVVDPDAVFNVIPNAEPDCRLWRYYKVDNWSHVGGRYFGDRDEHTYRIVDPTKAPNDGKNTHEWGHCFAVGGCKNWRIAETYTEAFTGDSFSVGAWKESGWVRSTKGVIENNIMVGSRRQGISATNCDDCDFRNNEIRSIGRVLGTSPRCGIDCEPDNDEITNADGVVTRPGTVNGRNTNNRIIGNTIEDCQTFGVNVFLRVDNLKLNSNKIGKNNSRGVTLVNATGVEVGDNDVYENGSEGVVVGKDTSGYNVHDNRFKLNYAKQNPVPKPVSPYKVTGKPTGQRDLFVAAPLTAGTIGENQYV